MARKDEVAMILAEIEKSRSRKPKRKVKPKRTPKAHSRSFGTGRHKPKRKPTKKMKAIRRTRVRADGKAIRRTRVFEQRYFIDKFKVDGDTEYEVFTVEVRGKRRKGEPPVTTKKQLIRKVQKLVR
jgi:hypothetical protein